MLASAIVPLAFFGSLGGTEMLFIAVIALLLFGKDLPNVLREWGRTFNEFRRHIDSVKSELNEAIYAEPERPKLQYHPEFHNRDPLPEQIPAEGSGDLNDAHGSAAAGNGSENSHGATSATSGDASKDDAALRPLPSD